METRPMRLPGPDGWIARLIPAFALGAGLVAYRRLFWLPDGTGIGGMLFRPGELPALLAIGLAGWLLWRRRMALHRLPSTGSRPLALALASLGAVLYVWSLLVGKPDLLLPSLAASGLALAAALRGRSGGRTALLPALVLLLGIALPKPLEDEVVWHLQRWTAQGAAAVLGLLDRDFLQSGVILRSADHTFHVIDACSGLNGIAILTLVGLIVRELFRDAGARAWLVVVWAPLLGIPLNMLRVAYVAASPEPERLAGVDGDHTAQGLAVVMAGTALLYASGWLLARSARDVETPALVTPTGTTRETRNARIAWLAAAICLAALALLSWSLPPFESTRPTFASERLEIAATRSGWRSEPAPHEPFFTGVFPLALHRRYQSAGASNGSPDVVDLLVGYADPRRPLTSRLISSEIGVPGPEWQVIERQQQHLWLLDREAELSFASRRPGGEYALTWSWRPRDRGLLRESGRALLGLDATPFGRERPRAVIRLVAYAPHDGQLVLDRARQRLDRFLKVFREQLVDL